MYKVILASQAIEFLKKLYSSDRGHYERVIKAIRSLEDDPFRGKPLRFEFKGDFSLRVGVYRILYTIIKQTVTIQVFQIGHRRDVYN